MPSIPKPRPIAFLALGYDLKEALSLLDRWDRLTDADCKRLGFTPSPGDQGVEQERLRLQQSCSARPYLSIVPQ